MSGQNNRNRKFQDFINQGKMADDAIGADELVDNAVDNAALGALHPKWLAFLYDPSAVSSLRTAAAHTVPASDGTTAQTIPDNAIIIGFHVDVVTPLASSGSATLAIGPATDDPDGIKAATAFNHASLVAATQVGGIPANSKKLTAARNLLVTVGTAALTAGKMFIYIQYIEGN